MSTAQDTGPVYALLADGTTSEIREAGPDDFGAVRALGEAMAPDNIYMRFFRYSGGSARLLYWRALECFIDGRLPGAVAQLGRLPHLPASPPVSGMRNGPPPRTAAWESPARPPGYRIAPKPPTAAR